MRIAFIIIIIAIVCFAILTVVMMGVLGGIGPLGFIRERQLQKMPGNAPQYHLENIRPKSDSPLRGKKALFLGSSVTYGACSLHTSMADYIGKLDGVDVTKEAVSGTTLSTARPNSYVERLKKVDKNSIFDFIVVQLSTNDASQKMPLGEISAKQHTDTATSRMLSHFDTATVTGAIEYIITYCQQTWHCPVIFYTGTRYHSEGYQTMVDRLLELQKIYPIGVIDLWNDPDMNAVSRQDYALYMHDGIHPTQAGYLLWWTPKIEEYLYHYL